jgi:hypothetical protein
MNKKILLSVTLGLLLLLTACDVFDGSSDSDSQENVSFEITTVNLTLAQPFSHLAVVIHNSGNSLFAIGQPASNGLELLAESGDNSVLLNATDSFAEASGNGVLTPGNSETMTLEFDSRDLADSALSLISMLVNTNDAFTAVNAISLGEMKVNDTLTLSTGSYDSGTEANSENAATIPGPAGGGEGFNAARDDIRDQVTVHSGVVSADNGLASSGLSQQHRWDNPVARISITRLQ